MRLLNIPTGIESISEDCRAHAIGQACRLQLTTLATEQVTQDLAEDVSHRILRLASRSGLSRNTDLNRADNDRLEATVLDCLRQLTHDLREDVAARRRLDRQCPSEPGSVGRP